jgi:hypothetical protein
VIPPSVDLCHSMVPVELTKLTITLFAPAHTGLDVVKDAVPPSGEAFTVNVVPVEVTGAHELPVVTLTFTS